MKKIIVFTVVAIAASGLIYSSTCKRSNSDNEKVVVAKDDEHSQSKFPLMVEESCMGVANITHAVIKNNSTVSSYKDAVVRVSYVKENSYVKETSYNDIKQELVYKEQTINEVFPPHSEVNVEFTINSYKDLIPNGWELINATVN